MDGLFSFYSKYSFVEFYLKATDKVGNTIYFIENDSSSSDPEVAQQHPYRTQLQPTLNPINRTQQTSDSNFFDPLTLTFIGVGIILMGLAGFYYRKGSKPKI